MSTAERKSGPDDELVGQELQGTYRIVRRVAAKDLATLYEAVHVRLTRKRFWIKVFGAEIDPESEPYKQFCREVDIVTNLGHSHIASVLDFGVTDNGRGYVVIAHMEGEDLGARLAGPEEITRDFILLVVAQVTGALQEAHDHGIVHGGLRPETIFLVRDAGKAPRVKLLDFGVSKLRSARAAVSDQPVLIDRAYYLSPEQARGAHEEVDRTTDLFALGVICYQCLCGGAVPFFGGSVEEIVDRICNQEHQPPTARNPSLHPSVDRFFAQALAKDRSARFTQMKTFGEKLYKAMTGQLVATVMYGQAPAVSSGGAPPDTEQEPDDTSRTLCDEGPPQAASVEQELDDLHDTIIDGALPNTDAQGPAKDLGATIAVPPEELVSTPEPRREEVVPPGYQGQTLAVDVSSLVVPKQPVDPGPTGEPEPGPVAPAVESRAIEPVPEPAVEGGPGETPAGDQHRTMAFDVEELVEPKAAAGAAVVQREDPLGATALPPGAGSQQASSPPAAQAPPASQSSGAGIDVFSETIVPTTSSQPAPAARPEPTPRPARADPAPQAVVGEIEFEGEQADEERTDLTTIPKPWPAGMKIALLGGIGFVVLFVLVLVLVSILR